MKIALIGYGKMGQLIAQLAPHRGHEIVAAISPSSKNINEQLSQLQEADIWIDFSHPDAVLDHLRKSIALKKPLVIGTTGWDDQLQLAKELVASSSIACLYAPNFSIGVHLFKKIVSYAAQLIAPFTEYDLSGIEYHHKHKLDAPSGTAKALTSSIMQHLPHLADFQFSSVRCGYIPGTHTLCLDSPVDTITLTHQARSREGFAYGALTAAEWLKNRKGFFTLDDLIPISLKQE